MLIFHKDATQVLHNTQCLFLFRVLFQEKKSKKSIVLLFFFRSESSGFPLQSGKRALAKEEEDYLRFGSEKRPTRRQCEVALIVDHLFFANVGDFSVEKTVLQVLWLLKVRLQFQAIKNLGFMSLSKYLPTYPTR